jgi:hypothetical protein
MVGGVRCQGNSGSGGGSKRLLTEEAAKAWPTWQRRGGALRRSFGSEVRWSASTRCKEEQRRGVNGRRRNEELLRQCAPIKATRGSGRWRRERWAGTTAAKPWARARRRPPLFEGARRSLGTSVQTVRLTGGLHTVLIFF